MSNAMSKSKSRWKGAMLAAIAGAVATPMLAKAQSMQVGLYLNPIGTTPAVHEYIEPYDPVNLYVYATVTGTSSPSAAYTDGLAYLYFNVNAAYVGNQSFGSFTAATPTAPFNGNASFNNSGAQGGNISSTITTTPTIVVGDPSNIALMAKPRAASQVYWNSSTGSAPNVVVNGNSVSFLVETLTYTPNTAAINNYWSNVTLAAATANPNTVSFNVSVPAVTSPYAGSNYFVGLNNPSAGQPAGSSNTSTAYSSTGTTVSLTNALPGDVNLDGTVNSADSAIIFGNGHFNATDVSLGVSGVAAWQAGDINHDGTINSADSAIVFGNGMFNQSLGGAPAGLAGATAQIGGGASAVPEPASLGLLLAGLLPMLGRRRSRA